MSIGQTVTNPAQTAPVASFFSDMQVRRLQNGPAQRHEPAAEQHNGAFLFLDLVSFTSLGEQLSAQGLKGAEVLSEILNAHFQPILTTIKSHGGDVLFFAGDALGVIWLAEDTDLAEATQRAALCALEIQQAMADVASPWPQTLRFRTSLGVGPVEALEVGGLDGHWMQLVRGTAIDLACQADRFGEGGHVVMSQHCARHLAPFDPQFSNLGKGFVRLKQIARALPPRAAALPPLEPHHESILSQTLTEAEHRHLYYPGEAVTAEFRRVTVLFADIPASDPNTLHAALRAAQEDVRHLGGVIYQLQEDDKGTGLVIVFGLPGASHADDPLRALLLSQRLSASFQTLGIATRLGIATGTTFCGPLGTPRRQQFAILGSAINLAARLMSMAEAGQTNCDDLTKKLTSADFAFEQAGSTRPKGFGETVPVYRPTTRLDRASAPLPQDHIIGRAQELAQINTLIDAVQADRAARLLMIEADPGVGKSTLLHHAQECILDKGLTPVLGATDPFETETAYFAFRNFARHWCGIQESDNETQALQRLEQLLSGTPELQSRAPLLGPVLGLDLPETELTLSLRGQLRSENTQRVLLHIAQRSLAETPAVLLIEDGHWMDGASWAFLEHLLDGVPQVLVILSSRPLDSHSAVSTRVRARTTSETLHLAPLSRDHTEQIIAEHLSAQTVAPETLDLVHSRAEGNPLFVREIVQNLLESGDIELSKGQAVLITRPEDAEPLPLTLNGVITSRIDRLDRDAQITIKAAAVLGRAFVAGLLQSVHPMAVDTSFLQAQLNVLEDSGFLIRTPGEDEYAFHHALARDAAYNMLSFAQRESLHHKTALALEEIHTGHLDQVHARLGYHFRMAGLPDRAAPHLAAAGITALDAYASTDAIELLTSALQLDEEHRGTHIGVDLNRTQWCRMIGQAYFNQDDQAEAANWYRRAIVEAGVAPRHPVFSILPTLVRTIFRPHSLDVPAPKDMSARDLERITAGLASARELGPIYLWESALNKFALNAVNLVRMASIVGPTDETAAAIVTMSFMMSSAGLRQKSENLALQAVRMAEDFGDVPQLISVQVIAGMVLVQNGAPARALPLLEAAEAAASELISGIWRHRSKYMLADALTWLGRYEEAHRIFLESAEISHSAEPHAVGQATAMAALNLLRLGRAQEAVDLLEGPNGVPHARDCGVPASGILALGILAEARLALGQRDAALQAAAEAEAQATKKDDGTGYYSGLFGYSSILRVRLQTGELGGPTGAALDLKRLRKLTKVAPLGAATLHLWQGLWEAHHNRPAKAQKLLKKAAEAARQLQHPFEEGQSLVELAKLCDADQRVDLLQQAAQVFERHNMPLDLTRMTATHQGQEQAHE